MNIRKNYNYFLKRTFSKGSTGVILFLHLSVIISIFVVIVLSTGESKGFLGRQKIEVNEILGGKSEHGIKGINPKINSVNDFFACVFPNLIFLPVIFLTFVFSPLSGTFWGETEETGQKTQEDGTDLFFLSTEMPTSRKQIFWRKVFFTTSLLVGLYLFFLALPLALILGKANYFSNFTGLQTLLFLGWNFVITPLLFLAPLSIFLLSLASLKSVWFAVLKGFGRLSVIFIMVLAFAVYQALFHGGEVGKKILEGGGNISKGLSQHYLLTTLTIMGVVIFLALLTLPLAYKDYKRKDLH